MTNSNGIIAAALETMTEDVREVNVANGWHDQDRRPAEGLALLHSEVSEWLEALRDRGTADTTQPVTPDSECVRCGRDNLNNTHAALERTGHLRHPWRPAPSKPEGAGSEAADVLIRLLDECDRQGIDLAAEYTRKIAYNATRPYRHGNRNL